VSRCSFSQASVNFMARLRSRVPSPLEGEG
jgi:hypothetical protein